MLHFIFYLERIFSNLISNAVNYSPENTTLKIYSKNGKNKKTVYVKNFFLNFNSDKKGLGLEIVEDLAFKIGAQIKRRKFLNSVTFMVEFPNKS